MTDTILRLEYGPSGKGLWSTTHFHVNPLEKILSSQAQSTEDGLSHFQRPTLDRTPAQCDNQVIITKKLIQACSNISFMFDLVSNGFIND